MRCKENSEMKLIIDKDTTRMELRMGNGDQAKVQRASIHGAETKPVWIYVFPVRTCSTRSKPSVKPPYW